jgi:hypothetical protein
LMMLTLLLSSAICAGGQAPATVTDTAPTPSERFPAEWYGANTRTSTQAPVKGAPYSATMVTSYTVPASPGHEALTRSSRARQYRDTAGRMRTEQPLPPYPGRAEGVIEIEVNDPVAHCWFHWGEPADSMAQPAAATVTCYTTLDFNAWDSSWGVKDQTAATTTRFNQTYKTEPLGSRVVNGLDTLGMRTTISISNPHRSVRQRTSRRPFWNVGGRRSSTRLSGSVQCLCPRFFQLTIW